MRLPHAIAGLLLSAALFAPSLQAQAPCGDEAAFVARFEAASANLDGESFRAARDVFQELLTCAANPAIAYNLARSHEGLGELVEAVGLLRELESRVYGDLPEAQAAEVITLRQRLSARLVRLELRVTGPLDYRVFIGERPLDLGDATTSPGSQTLRVEADGFQTFRRTINPPPGAVVPIEVSMLPVGGVTEDATPEPIVEAPDRSARRWGIAGGIVAVLAVGTLVAFLVVSAGDGDGIEHPTRGVIQTLRFGE